MLIELQAHRDAFIQNGGRLSALRAGRLYP